MTNTPHANQPVLRHGASLDEARGVVVLLHGRGASAEDILGLAPELSKPGIAFLAPQAAEHTWYPYSFLAPIRQNEPWLSSAIAKIRSTVDLATSAGVPLDRIVLAGFSQGACLATEFVARTPARYGGLIAFTGGLIGPPGTPLEYKGELAGMPAFLGSGDPDPHVPWARVEQSAEILKGLGAAVTVKRYPGLPHTISREELEHARAIVGHLALAIS
jgi:phospholipase/carboxylesterase